MKISEKQKRVIGFAKRDGFLCFTVGTVRSGKTFSCIKGFSLYTQSLDKPYRHLVLGRKSRVMEVELLPTFEAMAKILGANFSYTRFNQTMIIGKQLYVLAAGNDDKSSDLVQGVTAHSALFDETTLLPKKFFDTGMSRLSYDDSKAWAACNPAGPLHYLKTEWVDGGKCDELYPDFTFEDNPTLSDEVINRYRATFSGVFKKRMIDGLWVEAEGLIFQRKVVKNIDLENYKVLRTDVGVDYGPSTSTAFIPLMELVNKRNRDDHFWYVPDSLEIKGQEGSAGWINNVNKTDDELRDIGVEFAYRFPNFKGFVVDPSAASFRATLFKTPRRRFTVYKGYNKIIPGINNVVSSVAHGRIIISKKAKSLLEEMDNYCWDQKKPDTPVFKNDHNCDGLRYVAWDRTRHLTRLTNVKLPRGF